MLRPIFRLMLGSFAAAFSICVCLAAAGAAQPTTYTLPSSLRWVTITPKGETSSYQYAMIRGRYTDACDNIIRTKFPAGFVYPWHTNEGFYAIFTVLQGTLVIGFDKNHGKSGERVLPAGSVVQGLASEPHYGRAIGETIFDVYTPCKSH
jgi:quercetin dioxygenase-like cupin family protein